MKTEQPATSVREALRRRYAPPAFAYLEEVGNATGFACNRHADAVAMSLWPSRGLEVHGIEIKISRTDWLKELRNPAKADSIARFCDRWWLAVGDDTIVKEGELPPTWGLLVFGKGGKLVTKAEAAKLTPEPLERTFVASMLRRASESVEAVRREGFASGRAAGKKDASDPTGATKELEQLRKSLADFEEKSGLKIDTWDGGYIGKAVAELQRLRIGASVEPSDELDRAVAALDHAAQRLRNEKATMAKALKLAGGAA